MYALTYYFYKASASSFAPAISVMLLFLVLYCTGCPYKGPTQLKICCICNFKVSFLSVLEISFLLNLAALSIGVLCVDYVFPCSKINPAEAKVVMFYIFCWVCLSSVCQWHVWKLIVSCRLRIARQSYRDLDNNIDMEAVNVHTMTSVAISGNNMSMSNSARIRDSILTEASYDTSTV